MIRITETKEFKEKIEEHINNTTLEEFLSETSFRQCGKIKIKLYILKKLIEKEL